METQEQSLVIPEHLLNGRTAPSAAPLPAGSPYAQATTEWVEVDRIVVHVILAKRRGNDERSTKVGEVNYLDREQRPITLYAEPEEWIGPASRGIIDDANSLLAREYLDPEMRGALLRIAHAARQLPEMVWGTALERFVAGAVAQGNAQLQEASG